MGLVDTFISIPIFVCTLVPLGKTRQDYEMSGN